MVMKRSHRERDREEEVERLRREGGEAGCSPDCSYPAPLQLRSDSSSLCFTLLSLSLFSSELRDRQCCYTLNKCDKAIHVIFRISCTSLFVGTYCYHILYMYVCVCVFMHR